LQQSKRWRFSITLLARPSLKRAIIISAWRRACSTPLVENDGKYAYYLLGYRLDCTA